MTMKSWGVSDSLKLYNLESWGDQYFNINPAGNVTVHPLRGKGSGVDIVRVIEDVKKRGLQLPILFRFQDIIRHRVVTLNEAFRKTIQEAEYSGKYRGVYPVKVNQMREVVEEILDAGSPYHFGLEAGSKAELAAVSSLDLTPDSLMICNGYKDHDFIRLALINLKLGRNVIIVVEKLSEFYQILAVAEEVGVRPQIGVRSKLNSKGSGRWESSGGETAKFGLTTPELLHIVEVLREKKMEDCFRLVHFHIGSQITNIKTIKSAVKETARIYSKLRKMNIPVQFIDVGGGLGVDYDGSRTDFDSSTNYSLEEYVADIVYTIQEICENEEVPVPDIVSESGRALVAHHSLLVVDVFGSIEMGSSPQALPVSEGENDVVSEIRYVAENLSRKNLLEHFHDALERKEEAINKFDLGILSLEDRAKVEFLFWKICKKVYRYSKQLKYVPDEIVDLGSELADQYLCNFSVFQSMLDHWAIQHLFPIAPIHRLDEEPTREATLVDITCDSDGKVSKFIDLEDTNDTLRVHKLKKDEPYLLGFFLMGAYQDIMGDFHNLFGRVNEVHVFLDETEPGGYYVEEVIRGSDVSEILGWIQYEAQYLKKTFKGCVDQGVREGRMKPREGVDLQEFYDHVLKGYTYVDYEKTRKVMKGKIPLGISGRKRKTPSGSKSLETEPPSEVTL